MKEIDYLKYTAESNRIMQKMKDLTHEHDPFTMKNILKKLMSDNKEKPKLKPWQVVKDIKRNYNKAQQRRILELLQKDLAAPNPYGKNSLRG